ncbi:nuclear factor erythroid 2-related factor 3 [Tachyglossus aculeatus]|uniref:nuclear factor erythroid 2-related factor 3 n=1 Tax=Tachyglossus aculeatus TaxID=9261 RepID=UPI0018F52B11|nr:nuclear factor erythroid 2-related factor 3 [Tachyglossus aculeatus]
MPLAKDLLHPSPEEEKRKHKKKRLVQSRNSYFMDVKCPASYFVYYKSFELYQSFAYWLCQLLMMKETAFQGQFQLVRWSGSIRVEVKEGGHHAKVSSCHNQKQLIVLVGSVAQPRIIAANVHLSPSQKSTHRNEADGPLSLEDVFQLFSSPTENAPEGLSRTCDFALQPTTGPIQGNAAGEIWPDFLSLPELQGISLGDVQTATSESRGGNSLSCYSVNFTQAISHDVSLHEAMLLRSDASRRNSGSRNCQSQETFLPLNSSSTNSTQSPSGSNLTALFPFIDTSIRNATSQDLLSGLDDNIFDEINLMSLALEEGFNPLAVSRLFEEPDSDSGLSLNSSRSSASASNSDSSALAGDGGGAVGYSSDVESPQHDGLEGAVGGELHRLEYHPNDPETPGKPAFKHVLHNHTYHLLPNPALSAPESPDSWPGTSPQARDRDLGGVERSLSRDERRAKALRIPFSVDEIVSMPVEAFNHVLARYYLTDAQMSLIRDIRRRGKNKVAAQNCRKRKLDVILNLEDDVYNLRAQKESLKKEKAQCDRSISALKKKLNDLSRTIFSRLRDEQGRPVNPSRFALHCGRDGTVVIVPKELAAPDQKKENQKGRKKK